MSKIELWTAMPHNWDDETMLKEARSVIDQDAPFHDKLSDILPRQDDDRVLKLTIEVLDGTVAEIKERTNNE